jgi:hypothetical protein
MVLFVYDPDFDVADGRSDGSWFSHGTFPLLDMVGEVSVMPYPS